MAGEGAGAVARRSTGKRASVRGRRGDARIALALFFLFLFLVVVIGDARPALAAATPCDYCTNIGRACNGTTGACIACTSTRGCTAKQRCDVSTGYCEVKGIFSPFLWSDGVLLVLVFVSAGVSNAGGVGGGVLYVPMLALLGGFTLNDASANAQMLIFMASLANGYFNLRKRHVLRDAPRIDWNLVASTMPFFLSGTTLGSFLNAAFPSYFTALVLSAMLAMVAVQTGMTGTRMMRRQLRERRVVAEQEERVRAHEAASARVHSGEGEGGDETAGAKPFADRVRSDHTSSNMSSSSSASSAWREARGMSDDGGAVDADGGERQPAQPDPLERRPHLRHRRHRDYAPAPPQHDDLHDAVERGSYRVSVPDSASDARSLSSSALERGGSADEGVDGGAHAREARAHRHSNGWAPMERAGRERFADEDVAGYTDAPEPAPTPAGKARGLDRVWARVDPQLHADSLERMLALERPWFQWRYMLLLLACWLILFLFRLFSGSRESRPPGGLPLCGAGFWLLFAAQELLLLALGCFTIWRNVRLQALRERLHYPWYEHEGMGDMQWRGRVVFVCPLWSLFAGIFGTWLGLSGSTLLIPFLYLVARVDPVPVQSSMAIVDLVGSAAASIVFLVGGRLNIGYALFLGLFTLLGSYIGVMLVYYLVERFKLKALIVLSLTVAFGASVGIVLYIGVRNIVAVVAAGVGWQFTNICEPITADT